MRLEGIKNGNFSWCNIALIANEIGAKRGASARDNISAKVKTRKVEAQEPLFFKMHRCSEKGSPPIRVARGEYI